MPDSKLGPRFSVETLSTDGQRVSRHTDFTRAPSPVKKRHGESDARRAQLVFDNIGLDLEEALPFASLYGQKWDENGEINVDEDEKAKRYVASDEPLKAWRPFRDEYLSVIVSLEASKWTGSPCSHCPEGSMVAEALFRCEDCFEMVPVCAECCVYEHSQMPLHVIKKWNGLFFHKVSLQSLGLRVQLGHAGNSPCPSRRDKPVNFTVIHTNGIHSLSVDYCQCHSGETAGVGFQELLRNEWFPATHLEPATAVTFHCLEQFHMLTLTGKVTPFDYYTGLQRLTDNTGCKKVPERYREFLRMGREYRHLRACKRAARGNDGERPIGDTRPGKLAVECPACPRPGVNLPAGWKDAPPESRFIYTLFLAMDACFRLKRKIVSSDEKDPGLGTGFAYFVEDPPYQEYCQSLGEQTEMNSCTGLSAVDHANTRFSRGYAITSVGLGLCARHELVAKNGVGDIQKGEKFGNMAFIFASLLRHVMEIITVVLSYDINCQFAKNFASRVASLPPLVRFDVILKMFRWAIPKLHIMGHKLDCQREFNLNYMLGVGRTDGEGVERPWANIGPVVTSTREMGPGHRHDTLDDHWHDWNWRKIVALGKLLARRRLEAAAERAVQEEAYGDFSNNQLAQVPEWRAQVEAWEEDSSKPNPYKQMGSSITLQEVRLRLAQQESVLANAGMPAVHDISPSEFLVMGLDLEESQRRLRQEIGLLKSGGKAVGRDGRPMPAPAAKDVHLLFPSNMIAEQRERGVWTGLGDIKSELRDAQCRDALDQLQNHLIVKARLLTYKNIHARHQGATTRSQGLLARNESKIALSARRYQQAWTAKLGLVYNDLEKVGWRKLEPADIQCMQDLNETVKERKKREKREGKRKRDDGLNIDVEKAAERAGMPSGVSKGKKTISWIWRDATASGMLDGAVLQDGLRVEWTKCWARVRRWQEEERLLSEEMRRVCVSLQWKANWWEKRSFIVGFEPERAAGAAALAARQAAVYRAIRERFRVLWKDWEDAESPKDMGSRDHKNNHGYDFSLWPEELEGEEEEADMLVEEEGLDLGLNG
ncbi:hypothetical protein C8J56DRAFT_1063043 [Mycena floridula]|nr:hypothetical protein C8J56DRAFT_1063043 [Mycena floridula]